VTGDLAAFIRARLDEDEQAARDRRGVFPSPVVSDDGGVVLHVHPGGHAAVTWYRNPDAGWDDMARLRRWADTDTGWTAARVLRDVAAKRRIMTRHHAGPLPSGYVAGCQHCAGCNCTGWGEYITEDINDCPELQDLAAVYADHPDYREEWRPAG